MDNNMLNILWLAQSEYPSGSSLEPHSHNDYYQIYYVISGEGDFIAGEETVKLNKGMFLFARPNDRHGIADTRDVDGKPLRMLEVKYAVFSNELKENLNHIPNVCVGSDDIEEMLNLVFQEGLEMSPWYREIGTHTLLTALYFILRSQKMNLSTSEEKLRVSDQIKDYIKENYVNQVPLDKVAQHVGHSKNYICKTFKENTGMTINLYLNKVRIDQAAQLLINTNLEVAEISSNVGYNNVYHFIKTFKKIVGTSPGNFRKNELYGLSLASSEVSCIATIPLPDSGEKYNNE
ncbi:helix-turn-helix transcriptional regulator [Sporosarcina highlanderae]|uniref:AraC family transcriptional regulator n=1 Tax=Sporosarcina highlanderae TaxID=3035916 RepID=A0ABT8JUV9_9BACL|nr:AraC family transcriptional regulator [Sporosarcina highlanderae]MDN4608162.1 AraC family transcriptional regulator [Sporosarcina highlanderae]